MLQLSDSHFILQNSKYSLFSWFGLLIGQVEMPSAGLQQPPAGLNTLSVKLYNSRKIFSYYSIPMTW